jgi:anti-sigma-K factor RskA
MLDHSHVIELLPAYALGCLGRTDAIRVQEHLAICSACRNELQAYAAVVGELASAAPDAEPPLALKERLLDRVQPHGSSSPKKPERTWWERWVELFQRTAPFWGLASLVLMLVFGINNLMLHRQLQETQANRARMQTVRLEGTGAAPAATGILILSVDGQHGTLVVDRLPVLDEQHQYQLWLIKDGQRTSGGLLSVNSGGYGALWVSAPEPLSGYMDFGITIEPTGGSPGPTGEKVLGGSL